MKPTVLVTGAAGGLAQTLATRQQERFDWIGVDTRPLRAEQSFPGKFVVTPYTHRRVEDLFKTNTVETLVHLGRMPPTTGASRFDRYNTNVLGTRNLLQLAARYGVKRVIVFSTFHVYGAHSHNHLHITEDEPLRATQIFPELSDAVELDQFAQTFSLQNPSVHTLILRPANVIGPQIHNTITRLLKSKACPKLLGYDPMLQFIHEKDVAQALDLTLDANRSGVYNVAGEGIIPYSRSIEEAGSTVIPVLHWLAYPLVRVVFSRDEFPKHLLDYFRYPVIISDKAFRADFGYDPIVDTVDALKDLRRI
jgi:UDP-glucose 4-epimerase